MSPRTDKFITWMFICFMCLVAAGVTSLFLATDAAKVACLRAGYPVAKLTSAEWFCVKRQDNTDVVVSLASVKAGKAGVQ